MRQNDDGSDSNSDSDAPSKTFEELLEPYEKELATKKRRKTERKSRGYVNWQYRRKAAAGFIEERGIERRIFSIFGNQILFVYGYYKKK